MKITPVKVQNRNEQNGLIHFEDEDQFVFPSAFPGFAKPRHGTRDIIFRPTDNNIKFINQCWPKARWEDGAQEFLDQFIQRQQEQILASQNKKVILEDDGSYEYKTNPFDHQRQLFLLSRDQPWFLFSMEQGTGKTKPALDTAAYLYSQGKIDILIVIAPNGVHTNWIEEEIPAHLPDWCPRSTWVYSSKHTEKRLNQEYEAMIVQDGTLRIAAFNVEGFTSEKAREKIENIIITRGLKAMVVIDESQFIKNPSAKRTKYLTKVCEDVPFKRALSGTPITKGIEDIYAQANWLSEDILGFDSFYTFRDHFCTMGGFEMKQIVGYKNTDELIRLLDPYCFRVTKSECLDLPAKIYKRWKIDLTPKQRQIYDELKNKYYTDLEGHGTIEAEIAIVRLLRLQQIACGWFPNDDMIRIPGDNPKLEAARTHVEIHEKPTLIWCRFTDDVKLIHEQLVKDHDKNSVAMYFSGTSDEDRTAQVKDFQAGNLKAMVCSRAAARGLTLTASDNSFYHSNDYDLEVRLQSEDRNHRIGTVGNVTYTDCVAKNTVEVPIINALRRKKNIADIINQDAKSFFLEETEC